MKLLPRLVCWLAVLAWFPNALSAENVTPGKTLFTEGFEQTFVPVPVVKDSPSKVSGVIPPGWIEDSTYRGAEIEVDYGTVPDALSGKAALRLDVRRTTDGSAGLLRRGIAIPADTFLKLRVAFRSSTGSSVKLQLRSGKDGKPYWAQSLSGAPEWRTGEFIVPPIPAGDPAAELRITAELPASFELDDLQLTAVEPKDLAATGNFRGNLLPTTSFPAGLAKPWNFGGMNYHPSSVVADAEAPGPSGLPALRITPPTLMRTAKGNYYEGGIRVPFNGQPEAVHTFSVYLKGSETGQPITLLLQPGDSERSQTEFRKLITLTTEWQRYEFSVKLPYTTRGFYAATVKSVGYEGGRPFWMDQPQVEVGDKATPFQRSGEVELGLFPEKNFGLHFSGEPLKVNVVAYGKIDEGTVVSGTFYDASDRAFPVAAQPLAAGAESPVQRLAFTLPPGGELPFGFYRFVAEARRGEKPVSRRAEAILGRVRPPRLGDRFAPESGFGVHVIPVETHLQLCRDLGFKWSRPLFPQTFGWAELELPDGTVDWSRADESVRLHQKYKFSIMGVLSGGPVKYSVLPDYDGWGYWRADLTPEGRARYQRYAQAVAARYKNTIREWETWNESDLGSYFFDRLEGTKKILGKPENFAAIQKAGYAGVKAADPKIRVWWNLAWAKLENSEPFIEGATKAGIWRDLDGYSFHQYNGNFVGFPNDGVAKRIDAVRASMPPDRRNVPVWNSEGGFWPNELRSLYRVNAPVVSTERTDFFADWVVRYYTSTFANGIPKMFAFCMVNGNHGHELLNDDGTVSSLCLAFSNYAWHVEGKKFHSLVPLPEGINAYVFSDGKDSVAVLLSSGSGRLEAKQAPAGSVARDRYGNPFALPARVGDQPIYLAADGQPPEDFAKALAAAFP